MGDSFRITRARTVTAMGRAPKFIGKNSQRDNHTDVTQEPIVRLETDAGIEWYDGRYHLTGMAGRGVGMNERVYNERYRAEEKVYTA